MPQVPSALYLDFDNVFSGLLKLDPEAAIQFAQDPASWVRRLQDSLIVDGPRRWLVLRCYMNPAGSVPHPDQGVQARLYFSTFRPFFTGAGFDVIDCPRLTHTKNAADIRLVVDAMDALNSGTTYDEFVIASGDSDMTPLLVRLRAAARRTTIVSPSDAADAFTAVADRLIDGQQMLELVQGELLESEDDVTDTSVAEAEDIVADVAHRRVRAENFERFRSAVTGRYSAASRPLNLATLANDVRAELGLSADESGWFGLGGFVRALERLELPHARFSAHLLWDANRHEPPGLPTPAAGGPTLPEPMARLTSLLNLPRLPQQSWPAIYRVLSDYARSHQFSLTEATRWSRDRLTEEGLSVSRGAVGLVTNGAAYGGCPVYRIPPPSAAEIGAAFVGNVLSRAAAAEILLGTDDVDLVRTWLGGEPGKGMSRAGSFGGDQHSGHA